MEFQISQRSLGFPVLKVYLEKGEVFHAEPTAYLLHRGQVKVTTKKSTNFFDTIKKVMLAKEDAFVNKFKADSSVELWFAPGLPGDIISLDLNEGETYFVKDSCYLAHFGDIQVKAKFVGALKGLMTEGGFFWLAVQGRGKVFLNAYGGMEFIHLQPQETVFVDPEHIVAFSDTIKYETKPFGGMKSFLFGGEGFIFKLTGPGNLVIQTRNRSSLYALINQVVKKK